MLWRRRATPSRVLLGLALAFTLASQLVLVIGCAGPKRVYRRPPGDGADVSGERPRDTRVEGLNPAPVAVSVRVAVARSRHFVHVTCGGPWALLLDGRPDPAFSLTAGDTLEIEATPSGLRWLCDLDGGTARRVSVRPTGEAHLVWDDRTWRGDLTALVGVSAQRLDLINLVDLEDYLRGVLAVEMGTRREDERNALAAQAVAARTFTVARLRHGAKAAWDLVADTRDQAYRGSSVENPLCDDAVAATAGWILTADRLPIDAYYHAACGGSTARVDAVWRHEPRPYLVDRDDTGPGGRPYCHEAPGFAWTATWTGDELASALGRTLPDYLERSAAATLQENFTRAVAGADPRQVSEIRDVRIAERTPSGRVARLDVVTRTGTYHVRGDRVRRVLDPPGPGALRSTLVDVEVENGRDRVTLLTVRGRGYGHGLGLCQAGALARARGGQDLRSILDHYYPGAELVPLSAEVLP